MLTQESMTEAHVVAIWIGDFTSFEDLDAYINSQFEEDFGFRLNEHAMPEISEPSACDAPIKEVLTGFSFCEGWIDAAVAACERQEIRRAKAAVVFHHLRYHPEACRSGSAPLRFIGNIDWDARD